MSTHRLLTQLGGRKLLLNTKHSAPRRWTNYIYNSINSKCCRSMSTGFSTPRLDLNFQEGIAVVTMKSGDNRLHPEIMNQMHLVLDEVEKNKDCRAIITTGQDKFYTNGLDLEYVQTFTHRDRQLAEYLDKFNRLTVRMLTFPLPSVAAINGHAFAGGAIIALAHDLRVMRQDKGWISLNEVLIGVRIAPVLLSMLQAKITSAPVRTQAILFAKRFTAAEALQAGLIDRAVDQSELVESAKQLANQVLGKQGVSRNNLALFKKDLYRSVLEAQQIQNT